MSRLQDITTFTDTEINDLDYFWVNEIETSTATLSIASPCVVSKTAHNLEVGNKISFTTTGALPTGVVSGTQYYIISSGFGANSFQISATYNGTAINTSGTQSGTHTYTAYTSKKITGAKLKSLIVPSTPSSEVSFDKLTPTTAGVTFTPNTPTTTDILYYSTVDGSTWIYNGTTYVSKIIPNSTEFVLDSSFNDAGSNKSADISRNGTIKVRNINTALARFTQILSYGVNIVSDLYAQITQTAVSTSTYPLTRMTRKRGTISSQTNALNGDVLGQYAFSGGGNDGAVITAYATENHSGTVGTSIYFQNATTGSSGLTTSHWVDGTAKLNVMIGQLCNWATASTLASFDSSKNLVSLSTATYPSLTELSYVKGLTSSAQTQLNNSLLKSGDTITGDIANSSTGYFQIASGTTAQRPSIPLEGMRRYNTTTLRDEFYANGAWQNHARLSGDTFTGSIFASNLSGTNTGDQDLSGLLVKSNNLSDLTSASTARTNLGLGTLATQSGTFSGTSSGTNTGDQTYFDARVQSVTSSATVTPVSTNDLVKITDQAVGLTLANPTGTFTEGQALMIRIKDSGTAQTIAFGTNYRAIGVTLPTTTVISKTLYLGIIYNSTDSKFDVIGYNIQA